MPTAAIDPQTPIGELAAEQPRLATLFDRLRLDYCCGGERTLEAACREKNLDPDTVVRLLEAAEASDEDLPHSDWTDRPTEELIDHIVETHHTYLRTELPRLARLLDKVADVHGNEAPWLLEVKDQFETLERDLLDHIEKEEEIVFPYVRRTEEEGSAPETSELPGDPITLMEEDHEATGAGLERIRQLTDGFRVPPWACPSLIRAIEKLEDLEADVHAHVHKENNILFPRAR